MGRRGMVEVEQGTHPGPLDPPRQTRRVIDQGAPHDRASDRQAHRQGQELGLPRRPRTSCARPTWRSRRPSRRPAPTRTRTATRSRPRSTRPAGRSTRRPRASTPQDRQGAPPRPRRARQAAEQRTPPPHPRRFPPTRPLDGLGEVTGHRRPAEADLGHTVDRQVRGEGPADPDRPHRLTHAKARSLVRGLAVPYAVSRARARGLGGVPAGAQPPKTESFPAFGEQVVDG